METTHRKIELQSPLDLSYLINNAHVAARQKLDLHFPPSAAPAQDADDVMKARVDELVQEYIARVFEGVSGNLAVNGLEGVEMDEARRMAESSGQELEPYDTKLAERLKVLSTQIEDLTLHLANQRRTAPLQAAASYAARLDREDEEFEHARRVAEQEGREKSRQQEQTAEGDAFNAIMVGTQGIKNWGECEKSWEQATGQLVHVKQNIGATSARLVQARDAAVYLHQLGN